VKKLSKLFSFPLAQVALLLCIGLTLPATAQYADLDRADW